MSGWRLPAGGRIRRERPLQFRWAERSYIGYEGDTLASALLANGVSIFGRSFKYHRPRGLLAAGLEEPNAIVEVGSGASAVPNLKATQIELFEGLQARPVNANPSLKFDLLAINNSLKRFLPAGFYYKTFKWPHWGWYEPTIRKAAGLGTVPDEIDLDSYEHRFAHVDTLVVGGGASGIAAARAAAQGGESVLLVEGDRELGGGLLASVDCIDGFAAEEWLARAVAELESLPNLRVMRRTLAFGYYDHNLVGLSERLSDHLQPSERGSVRERLWKVRAGRVILATGAFERPLLFGDNDLPGVMLASAAQTYALRYGVAPGRSVVVATNNDGGYSAALAMSEVGVPVVAIVDSRAEAPAADWAARRGIRMMTSAAPLRAKGGAAVSRVVVSPVGSSGANETIACDALLVSGGWSPAVHLHSQSGGKLSYNAKQMAFLPADPAQDSVCVGAAAGIFDVREAVTNAEAIGRRRPGTDFGATRIGPLRRFPDGDPATHKVWLDYQSDVTVGDVQLAARENYRSVEHVKRYTTLGMATDQGKTSNFAAIHVLADLLGKAPDEIGTTKFRPPFEPVTIGAFAGRSVGAEIMPPRRLAAHDQLAALGASMEQYGGWLRPTCFPRPGESEMEAVAREVLAVRTGVGLFEASPIGKIEVKGSDAATFLDRMYVNTLSSLKPLRCRYAIMLTEHGIVYDDGVIARVADDHFLVGTTSGRAAAVADRFDEWLQCEWPQLQVLTEDVTTGWAVINVAGPRAREVLERVGMSVDLDADAFPHMSLRITSIAGVPMRIQRVSFTGEHSYELMVPWGYGASLWDVLITVGGDLGIVPFGIEALMTMRIEKGFLHVGSDTDGTTLPQDIGFRSILARKSSDFVGRRSTKRSDALRQDRRQLVGLLVEDGGRPLVVGSHVLPSDSSDLRTTDGWVTSAAWSPTLERAVALALVVRGRSRVGEAVRVWDQGLTRTARIADARFYDPDGKRLNG